MNVYDFDKTIYIKSDSSAAFYQYCLFNYLRAVLPTVPGSIAAAVKLVFGKLEMRDLKQQLFSYLRNMRDIDGAVADFWAKNFDGVGEWYLRQMRADDLIISASPEYFLAPVAERLGVRLIATRMDKHTGRIDGANCHDEEKVRRFNAEFPGAHVEEFYSDSMSDAPMAALADKAFMVRRGKLSPWPGK